jgi:hypothetical protein
MGLMLTGCSSVRIVGVTPYELEKTTEQNKINNEGNNHIKLDVDFKFSGYDVIIEGTQYVTFDATVKNISDKTVEVSDEAIYFIPIIKNNEGIEIELEKEKIEFSDKIIKKLDEKIKYYAEREKENEVSVCDNIRGLMVTWNYLTFGKHRKKLSEEYEEDMAEQDKKRKEYIAQRKKYEMRKDIYKDIFLRKGILNPNEQVSGKVYLRRDIDVEMLKVYFPIENNEYLFKFKLRLKQ